MSFTTALENLHEDLILIGQSEARRNELASILTENVTNCLTSLSSSLVQRHQVKLYPCELLAVQHFLTQLGFHLHRVSTPRSNVNAQLTYSICPNWK